MGVAIVDVCAHPAALLLFTLAVGALTYLGTGLLAARYPFEKAGNRQTARFTACLTVGCGYLAWIVIFLAHMNPMVSPSPEAKEP